jgi:Zn-dependent peptidase ImmA (M78 family)/transcriptional regulator with XRE-family HTH domain
MALGDRLKFARDKAGLTIAQAGERTGIGASSICEFENGKREPKVVHLSALAEAYRRSISFFLGEGDLPCEVVLWRQRPDSPAAAEIQLQFLRLCEQYHNLETWCYERAASDLPFVDGDGESYSYSQAEQLAYKVRNECQLGDRPGTSLLRVLEEVCKVKVFHLTFEPTGTAACTLSPVFGAAVLLNAGNVRWRRNFDLAHELFHLLTWRVFRSETQTDSSVASPKEEKLATCFASHLLMPTDAVRLAINGRIRDGRIPFDGLFDVAREFDVSVEALLWRMKFLYNRSEDQTRDDVEQCQAGSAPCQKRERDDPPARPDRFFALAIRALRKGDLSIGRFAEYMGISRRQAMHFDEAGTPDHEETEVAPA